MPNIIVKEKQTWKKEAKQTRKFMYKKYPFEEVSNIPLLCAEVIGYLKALIQYFPSEEKWAGSKRTDLMLIMIFYSL